MITAPLPPDESERLRALQRLEVLDSEPEREFDALVETAALICGVPISLVSLVDTERQWFKAQVGLGTVRETHRDAAFCAHAILGDEILEVADAQADPRFCDNPLVLGAPDIRFYAGAPLQLQGGERVGTLCVIDRIPRTLSDMQREALRLLSIAAVRALETRQAARAFVVSEMRFRTLSEASPLGVFATDALGACTYTNARWQDIYGLAGPEALGTGWTRSLHPEDRTAVFAQWQGAAEQGHDFDLQFRLLHGDGSVRHVRSIAHPVRGDAGRITEFVGLVEDVTQRLAAQRVLDDERERMAAILAGTGAGTWEWNVQTGETRYNERWAEIVGMTLAELSPTTIQTWTALAHPDDLERSGALLQTHFAGQRPVYECEARMRHRAGHWVWVLDRGQVRTRTPDGQPEWMFGTHLDVTEHKTAEEALRQGAELLNRTGALANVGGWELDVASGRLTWSAQTCRIHGLEPGYQPQLSEAIDFYAPEARPVVEAAVNEALATGYGWNLELPLIQVSGQRIWVRAVGQVERDNGRPVRLTGAFQDVTQQVTQRQALEAAQQRVVLATESGGIGIWEHDLQTGTHLWDGRTYQLFGLPPDCVEDPRQVWARQVHTDDRQRTEQSVAKALEGLSRLAMDFRVIWPDGSAHHLQSAARVTLDPEGRPAKLIGVNWDVTPLRELNDRLEAQHELLRVTLQSIGDAVITTDAASLITWLNPAAERMTGWLTAEALGRPLAQVFHTVNEDTRLPTENPAVTCLKQGQTVGLASHTLLISRNGDEYGIEDSAAPIRNREGQVLGVVLVFHDVTEQRRLAGEMSYRASHDPLTGLVNRAEFEARLRRTLEKAHQDRSLHALLYIDLDQFKLVNDACGHSVGDQLLQQVAKLLRDTVRTRDTLARLGGDEFAVILEHCPVEQAQRVAEKICDRMEEFRFLHEDRRFRIGASIGLVPVDSRWANPALTLQAADSSCYAAKEAGRNRVHLWFDTDLAMRARQGEMQWATRLEQALDEDRFVLYAQRIEAVTQPGGGLHAEVLLRMLERDGSLIPPGAFLPAAERFHLATRIDRWVLKRAVKLVQALPDLALLDTLCVNLSGHSVGDRAFHRQAIDTLAEAGADVCQRLCVEITETSAITIMADAALFIEQVRALGVRVALDDFGAGASSFGYLKNLKVDLLKIDGSFIRDIVDDPLDDAAVRCFVDVARVVGVKTVAEFVDCQKVYERVCSIGIDYVQGFLLHRPEPIENLLSTRARH